jgi:hypothetical protein
MNELFDYLRWVKPHVPNISELGLRVETPAEIDGRVSLFG